MMESVMVPLQIGFHVSLDCREVSYRLGKENHCLYGTKKAIHPAIYLQFVNGVLTFETLLISLGVPSKCRQRLVGAIVLISVPDWSKMLSNFGNII